MAGEGFRPLWLSYDPDVPYSTAREYRERYILDALASLIARTKR